MTHISHRFAKMFLELCLIRDEVTVDLYGSIQLFRGIRDKFPQINESTGLFYKEDYGGLECHWIHPDGHILTVWVSYRRMTDELWLSRASSGEILPV